ncbi:MAG: hypothetical protein ACFFCQ_14280, partial [Promethearchaeota archaeon]
IQWDTIDMQWNENKGQFETTIPGSTFIHLPIGTTVQYYITIEDIAGNVGNTTTESFTLIDTTAPHISLPSFPENDSDGIFTITFEVTDPSGISSLKVWHNYDDTGWEIANITIINSRRFAVSLTDTLHYKYSCTRTDYVFLLFYIEMQDNEDNIGYLCKDGLVTFAEQAKNNAFLINNLSSANGDQSGDKDEFDFLLIGWISIFLILAAGSAFILRDTLSENSFIRKKIRFSRSANDLIDLSTLQDLSLDNTLLPEDVLELLDED